MNRLLPILFIAIMLFSCAEQEQKINKSTSNKGKTLMAIFAHPDDEIVISPILSKYQKEV